MIKIQKAAQKWINLWNLVNWHGSMNSIYIIEVKWCLVSVHTLFPGSYRLVNQG